MASEKTKEKSQVERFREKARELETNESEEAFDALVKKIAKRKPAKSAEKPSKSGKRSEKSARPS